MMRRTFASIMGVVLGVLCIATFNNMVFAGAPLDVACTTGGTGEQVNSPACQERNNTEDPIAGDGGLLNVAANIVALLAGIAGVIVIILGGITLITSGGDAQKAAQGRSRVLGGIIGLVVVVTSWLVISFIVGKIIR